MQFIQLVKRIKWRIYKIFKGKLQTEKGRNESYSNNLGSYIQSNTEFVLKYDYSTVKMDPDITNIATDIFHEKVQEITKKTAVTM